MQLQQLLVPLSTSQLPVSMRAACVRPQALRTAMLQRMAEQHERAMRAVEAGVLSADGLELQADGPHAGSKDDAWEVDGPEGGTLDGGSGSGQSGADVSVAADGQGGSQGTRQDLRGGQVGGQGKVQAQAEAGPSKRRTGACVCVCVCVCSYICAYVRAVGGPTRPHA